MALGTTYRRSVEFWKFTVQEVSGDWAAPTPESGVDVLAQVTAFDNGGLVQRIGDRNR